MAAGNDRRRRRRHSWNRSQSESFGPVRQVGLAYSIGFPLIVVGVLLLAIASSEASTLLWVVGGGLFAAGILTAGSGRIT